MKEMIAREFEDAAVEVLTYKTLKAIKEYKIKTMIVAGGVSANKQLKEILTQKIKQENPKIKILFPARKLSTDNAVMISLAGYFKFLKNKNKNKKYKIKAEGNLKL